MVQITAELRLCCQYRPCACVPPCCSQYRARLSACCTCRQHATIRSSSSRSSGVSASPNSRSPSAPQLARHRPLVLAPGLLLHDVYALVVSGGAGDSPRRASKNLHAARTLAQRASGGVNPPSKRFGAARWPHHGCLPMMGRPEPSRGGTARPLALTPTVVSRRRPTNCPWSPDGDEAAVD